MSAPYLLVWDLDGTLGDFSALDGGPDFNAPLKVRTRPGIADALRALQRAGFRHSLLTMATPTYAEMVLRGTGMRDLFDHVEGMGQRRKGDVAGVSALFDIPESSWPHRMLFIGDRMVFDEPDRDDVVFHLEPWALARPADHVARLVLRLRDAGGGSLRQGFLHLGREPRRWYRLFRRAPIRVGKAVHRILDGVDPIIMIERDERCPVVAYAEPCEPPAVADEHTFVPAEMMRARG